MIFYDKVVKTIVEAVKEKTRETTNKLHQRILTIENTNLLFATKKEVEKRVGEIYEMINLEKLSILKVIEEKVAGVASMDSVISLAQGINNRLDNMYYALEVTKNQAVNQATEMVGAALNQLSQSITSNTQEIAKTREETLELKGLVDTLLPQIVQTLDTSSLTSIIDSLVQVELKAIEDRLKAEMEASVPTEEQLAENLSEVLGEDSPSGVTQSQYTTPGVYITELTEFPNGTEEEMPAQG